MRPGAGAENGKLVIMSGEGNGQVHEIPFDSEHQQEAAAIKKEIDERVIIQFSRPGWERDHESSLQLLWNDGSGKRDQMSQLRRSNPDMSTFGRPVKLIRGKYCHFFNAHVRQGLSFKEDSVKYDSPEPIWHDMRTRSDKKKLFLFGLEVQISIPRSAGEI